MYSLLVAVFLTTIVKADQLSYYALENASQYFEEFILEYKQHYVDQHERAARFEIFKKNLENINELNREKGAGSVYGITQFTDLTPDEFVNMYTGFGGLNLTYQKSKCRRLTDRDIPAVQAPESLDWRQKKAVTRVRDQGLCSSCYTFSTVGLLEGQNAIKHKELVELSEQQILDCDKRSMGCLLGGFMSWSLTSLMEMGGVMKGADYPYTAKDGHCQFKKDKVVVKVASCSTFALRSQEKLKHLLVQYGPVAIAVKGDNFQHYKKGVVSDRQCTKGQINHAVLLVGYGKDPYQGPYWLVKNSYGAKFGEAGYFRMARGENAHSCGVMNQHMATAVIA